MKWIATLTEWDEQAIVFVYDDSVTSIDEMVDEAIRAGTWGVTFTRTNLL